MDVPPEALPFCDLVGCGITLFPGSNIFNCRQILQASEKNHLLRLGSHTKTVQLLGSKKVYSIPEYMSVVDGDLSSIADDLICDNGANLSKELAGKPYLSQRYLGVSMEDDGKTGSVPSLDSTTLFGLWSTSRTLCVIRYETPGLAKDIFNVDFIVAAKRLPPWEENNPSVRGTFAEFFARWGTHIVLGYSLGARYQLQITRPDASSESKNNFRTHIETEFAPIIGKDEGLKDTTQYREYLGRRDRGFCVLGGHPQIADALARNPTERRLFDNWLRSIDLEEQNDIINIQVENICNLFTGSPIQEYMLIGKKLEPAWKFHSRFLTATGIFKVRGISGATDRVSWCGIRGVPGISMHATARPGSVILENTRTMFNVRSSSGDQAECDIILSAPPATPLEVTLVSSKEGIFLENPFVFDLRLQLYPEGLSGAITIILGDKVNEGKVTIPNLAAIGDYTAE